MITHFLYQQGEWEGSGRVTFSASPEVLPFTTHWTISNLGGQRFRAVQKVTIADQHAQTNVFTVTERGSGEFQLFLENETLGVFSGEGISDEKQLAWEFTHHGSLEGMEVYDTTKDGEYAFRAEYSSDGEYSTIIHGTMTRVS